MTESIDKNLDCEIGDGPVILNPLGLPIAQSSVIRWNEWCCCICAAPSLQEFHSVAQEHAFMQIILAILSSQILTNYNNYRRKRRDYEDRDRYFAELRGAIVTTQNTFVLSPRGTIPPN